MTMEAKDESSAKGFLHSVKKGLDMDELIIDFIKSNVTSDAGDLYLDIIELLEEMGFLDTQTIILNYINDVENVGSIEVIDNIIRHLSETLNKSFAMFGVYVDDDTRLDWRFNLLKDIIELEKINDPQSIIGILENDESPEEKLSDILEHVTGNDSNDYLVSLVKVSPSIIAKLKDIYQYAMESNQEVEVSESDLLLMGNKRKVLKLFRDYLHDELGLANDLLSVDIPLLLEFGDYVRMVENKRMTADKEDYAKALIVFAIICKQDEDILTVLRNHMEDIHPDPVKAIEIEGIARRLTVEFQNFTGKAGGYYA